MLQAAESAHLDCVEAHRLHFQQPVLPVVRVGSKVVDTARRRQIWSQSTLQRFHPLLKGLPLRLRQCISEEAQTVDSVSSRLSLGSNIAHLPEIICIGVPSFTKRSFAIVKLLLVLSSERATPRISTKAAAKAANLHQ